MSPPPRGNFLARWIFLRLLALVFAIAFASLWVQVTGLIGSQGILPIAEYVDAARRALGGTDVWRLPTISWWDTSDSMLRAQCVAGIALSAALFVGLAPRLCIALLWALYLSLTTAGQEFLSFQWDVLLLETAFFAFFYAPSNWLPGLARESPPSFASLWLMRWLLVRLMFASGAVKLASLDPTWRDLTALTYHYETQPLPTPLAWYAHQLPLFAHQASCVVMYAIEMVLPWFVFWRRLRLIAAFGLIGLQAVIALTGNYGFFNLLSIALCVPLLDDACLARFVPSRFTSRPPPAAPPRPVLWRRIAFGAFAVLLFAFTSLMLLQRLRRDMELPFALTRVAQWIAPLRTLNTYGLFAVMTTERPEIRIEGSTDGVTWREYSFRYKPGDVARAPGWVAPHMPRLDWQMWFAALGRIRNNPWVLKLLERLRQGSPEVLALLASNPFPDGPPAYARATLWDYRFTTSAERAATGDVWVAKFLGVYAQVGPENSRR